MSPDLAGLIALLEAPAALADATGTLVVVNDAFEGWAPGYRRAQLSRRPGGSFLVVEGRASVAVRAEAVESGFLVLSSGEGAGVAQEAVITSVVRRLDRARDSLENTLGAALRERPPEPVVNALHEALAAVEELRALRQLVLGLSPTQTGSRREAVNLGSVTHDAVAALSGPLPLTLGNFPEDCVVDAIRERVFWAVAALVGALSRAVPEGETVRISVESTADSGRVRLGTASGVPTEGLDVDPARQAAETAGGRLLVDPDGAVVMQFPAFSGASGLVKPRLGTVLVVDDDPSVLALMGAVLRREGYGVIEADNGVAASMFLRTRGRSLKAFVTDAVLPGRGGTELVLEARRWLPQLPVLLVTAHDDDVIGEVHAPVLRKPFTPNAFRDRIAALIAEEG